MTIVASETAHLIMTSEERHEARYQRRKQKRLTKQSGATFEEVFSLVNLCSAGKKACCNARWKTTTLLFEANLCENAYRTREEILNNTRKFKGFHSFKTAEHGKVRNIDALPIKERMAQKCLCSYYLTQEYSRSFITDNSASVKNRGMDYALKRLKHHLAEHYKKYGDKGGIFLFDFKGYFASLSHEVIKERARAKIKDDGLYNLFCSYVDDFRLLAAYNNDEKGVGLGSEVSQIIALDYASPLDHWIKDELGVKGYGRYMDDGYVISEDVNKLKQIQSELQIRAEKLGLRLSTKKNYIVKFHHNSFRFLKLRFSFSPTGKVVSKLDRAATKTIRRRLVYFKRRELQETMTPLAIWQSYQSWRSHSFRCNAYKQRKSTDSLFLKLFPECKIYAYNTMRGRKMNSSNEYILCEPYKGKTANGLDCSFNKYSIAKEKDQFLYIGDIKVCATTSEVGHRFFGANYDGEGLLRQSWIKRIAFWSPHNHTGYRLNEEQIRILEEYYPVYLRHDVAVILFNEKFYKAPITHLKQMGEDLKMFLEDMA